jgi:hypothetical protein
MVKVPQHCFDLGGLPITCLSHVWRVGGIRAQSDPGAYPSGLGRRPSPWPQGGRPPKLTDDDIEAAKALLANPDIVMALQ